MPLPRAIPVLFALLFLPLPRPAAAQRWVSVDVGLGHTCALDSAGRAFCWGINHHGQLGAPTPQTCGPGHHGEGHRCWASASRVPVAVGGGMRFRALGVGRERSCGLDERGRAWCWGQEVGTERAGCASGGVCSFRPVPFAPEQAFRSLHVGEDAVCGVTGEGAGLCWRTGHGAEVRWTAVAVASGERLARVDHYGDWMDRGEYVACAVTEDGRALCQGENTFAQLGAGDTVPRAGAVPVASTARFVRVLPHGLQACGLTTEGAALCWGATAARPSWPGGAPPRPDLFACRYAYWCSGPRPAAAGVRFAALTYLRDRFCGVEASSGRVHCWGTSGVPARVAAGVRFTALEGEETHACGLTAEGAIWCWGQDVDEDLTRPVRAPDPPR